MFKGIGQRINKDMVFQAPQRKNPLKVMLSEGHILETLASVASFLVGTRGFEPRTPTVSG
jgi:hypothetical protein